jgi:DNA repair protein RadA/Sms
VDETAADLGVVVALASSFLDRPVHPSTALLGEVGLAGEVRGVSQAELRVREAIKLGFDRFLLPQNNLDRLALNLPVKLTGVTSVENALKILF